MRYHPSTQRPTVKRKGPVPRSLAERLWPRVDTSGDCWIWTGARVPKGYGKIGPTCGGAGLLTHRVVWELTYGPIPEGLCVLHRCDNPPCCRPDHLFLGTRGDNNRDKAEKGRAPAGDLHWARQNPERVARGDQHTARIHPERFQGERNGQAKLTDADVREIRRRHDGRYGTGHRLALEYGVSDATISMIVNGKGWQHLS